MDARSSFWEALQEIALDLRWSWSHVSDDLWARLDPELWALTRNPWIVLQSVSRERLAALAAEPGYREAADEILRSKRELEIRPLWFQNSHPGAALKLAAYFSMEFMLSEALPIYSGGLGNVAGDHLKSASDLGVPVVGVGLLYQQGSFRQEIDASGAQLALYTFNEPGQLPVQPLRSSSGEWLRFAIEFPGWKLWVRPWEVKVGRVRLFLLDTNDPANLPAYRGITGELYGGGPEARLRQQMLLGIGGWRLLRTLGLDPEVCHLNEGHAAFAALERARCWMADHNASFDVALTVTRAGNLFTTHTPVGVAFDQYPEPLMRQYLSGYAENSLRIGFEDLLRLGQTRAGDSFNMAWLAIRCSAAVNGVSRLHGQVSRRLFQVLFPRWPEAEVPVGHVTNGVHMPTWDSPEADRLWTCACGKARWLGTLENLECGVREATDEDLWAMRAAGRKALVEFARERLARERAGRGRPPEEIARARTVLDENALTLGFARRFVKYKRPNLLLHDPERFARILNRIHEPVQLLVAGKAHPKDPEGQAMIHEWVEFSHPPDVRGRVVFLADYDMLLADQLVHGVDLWINTPQRPWEACGTSGMKVLVNGGLNLSVLDGWWAEAYSPGVGWAIGGGREHDGDPARDASDAEEIYRLLEQEIIPLFYSRDTHGIPRAWVARIRESMARLTPQFSANRSVRQYTEEHYLPLAAAFLQRAASGGDFARRLLEWRRRLLTHWPRVHFGSLRVEQRGGEWFFEVSVYLGEIDPADVRVQLYADPENGEIFRQDMTRGEALVGSAGGYLYAAAAPANRPASHYTPRIIPAMEGAFVPLECAEILWQR